MRVQLLVPAPIASHIIQLLRAAHPHERKNVLHCSFRTSCAVIIALVCILYAFHADAQTVSPAYSSQFRLDKLLTLNGAPTQMAWGPDGRLYIRFLNQGVDSFIYNNTTGTLNDRKQAVTGFPGIGLAFHQNHMYLTTLDSSIVKLNDQNGNGIWGEPGELSVRIATHIPTGDHNVDQLLVRGNSLYVGIGIRTTNGYSGEYTASSFDDYGGQGYGNGGLGKTWGDSAYNGTISWIQDLTAVADIEGSANAYVDPTLTQFLIQQDDSPFVLSAVNKLVVHSAGTRNPYGMCFDRFGELWFTNNFNRNKTNGDGTVGFGYLFDQLGPDFSMDVHDQLFRASRWADYGYANVNWRAKMTALGYHPVRSITFDNLFNPGPYVLTDPANPDGLGPSSSSNGCGFFYADGLPSELVDNVFIARFFGPITEAPPGTHTLDYRDIVAVDTASGKVRRIASGFVRPLSVFWDGAQRLLIGSYADNSLYALVALNNTSTIQVTVQTNPSGAQIAVDGSTLTAPQTFNWVPGSSHTIATSTSQGSGGTRYVFANWSDGGAISHIVAPTTPTTYTANFTTQFLLSTNVSPAGSGTVSANPASVDGFYNSGTSVQLTATANVGYAFSNWSGDVTGIVNPTSLAMSAPKNVTANFNVNSTSGLRFVPVTPCRVADTRDPNGPFGGPVMAGGSTRSFTIPSSGCGIPSTALAYSLNVTVVPTTTLNYLTIWPAGQTQPLVSTLNSFDGRVKANAAIIGAGASGAVSVFVANNTHVILDINGYFALSSETPTGLVFYPLTPCRVMDTREPNGPFGGPILTGGAARTVPVLSSSCGIPSSAAAYSLNMTVVPSGFLDYLTTWPTGTPQPFVSTLNDPTATVVANAAIVPAGTGGSINVFVTQQTHLIIDINGYFAPPGAGGLLYYPMPPCRVLDTRNPNGPFGGPAFSGQRDVNIAAGSCAVPAATQAYSLNATVVPHGFLGYLTLWPAGQAQPFVSTLNSYDASVVSNAAVVPTTTGAISAFASETTDLILDLNGVFAP